MRTLVIILVLTLSLGAPLAAAEDPVSGTATPPENSSTSTDSGDPGDCRPLCSSTSSSQP